jgi:hypothetical protein
MKIVKWTKTIYGDSTVSESEIFDFLGNMSPGKHVIGTEHGVGEIEVNAPNVDEEDFALFNVCPVGTINVEEACIADAKTMKPIKKMKKRDVARTDKTGHPVHADRIVAGMAVDSHGRSVFKTIDVPYKTCPEGWVMGERTDKINIIGKFDKKIKSQGIFAKAADLGIDFLEPKDNVATPHLDVKKQLVCVKKEEMPMEPKYVKLVTDSIIGWGGYGEFPYWDLNWDAMIHIADVRYERRAELLDKTGFAVCETDYRSDVCYLFDEKGEAESVKETLKYFDTNKFQEDSKEELIEEFIDEKSYKQHPPSQKNLDDCCQIIDKNKYQRIQKNLRKKYKEELEAILTDEVIGERMERNKSEFYEDLPYNSEHYLGVDYEPKRYIRELGLFIASKREGKKDRLRVVIAEEL